jgi:hypothetical protein
MAWIESHQELGRHPKTRKLARALNISRPAVVGHLHYLWWWALDFAQDGDLSRYDADELAEATLWDGDPDAFIEALMEAGFIDHATRHLHDWNDYAGKLLDQRKSNARRQADWRNRQKQATDPEPVVTHNADETSRNGNVTVTSQLHNALPYLTVPNRTVPEDTDSSRESSNPTFVGAADADTDAQSGDTFSEAEADTEAVVTARRRHDSEPLPADGEAMRLATLLRDRIRAHTPDARVPATPAKLQPWAKVFDLMLRLDRRAPPDIEAVIAYATSDTFWRANILSPGKLREKYDPLNIKRRQERQQAAQNGHRPVTAATASRPILTADDVYPD